MVAVCDDLQHPVTVEVGELNAEDAAPGVGFEGPLGFELAVDDTVQIDAVGVGDRQPRHLVGGATATSMAVTTKGNFTSSLRGSRTLRTSRPPRPARR